MSCLLRDGGPAVPGGFSKRALEYVAPGVRGLLHADRNFRAREFCVDALADGRWDRRDGDQKQVMYNRITPRGPVTWPEKQRLVVWGARIPFVGGYNERVLCSLEGLRSAAAFQHLSPGVLIVLLTGVQAPFFWGTSVFV